MVRGTNPSGGEIFCTRPDRPCGPPSLLYNGYRDFPGSKTAGAWRWPRPPSSAEVKERVDLYLYSPSGPSWLVLGWTLPLHFMYSNCYVCSVLGILFHCFVLCIVFRKYVLSIYSTFHSPVSKTCHYACWASFIIWRHLQNCQEREINHLYVFG